ncbi:MAG: hypothetical protein JSV10_05440, partial [Candidatus Zixiibacteriota bacterium]
LLASTKGVGGSFCSLSAFSIITFLITLKTPYGAWQFIPLDTIWKYTLAGASWQAKTMGRTGGWRQNLL